MTDSQTNSNAKAVLELDKAKLDAILADVYKRIPNEQALMVKWLYEDGESPRDVAASKGLFTKMYKELKCDYENGLVIAINRRLRGDGSKSKAAAELEAKQEMIADKCRTIQAEVFMDCYTQKYFVYIQTGKIITSTGG